MAAPFDELVIHAALIGRDPHLAVLARLLEDVRCGHGATALVAGEAGVGKSRLLAELRDHATPAMRTLQGNAFEPDRALPYAPILDLLRAYLATCSEDDVRRDLGPVAAEIVKLLPELAAALPDVRPAPAYDPEQDKRRLIHALVRLFAGFAAREPLLVIVEDLHWSDDTSLELLPHLARLARQRSLLLVLTYRSDEVQPALQHMLAGLDRERLAIELPLERLTLDEVDLLLRGIFGQQHPIRREFLLAIHALTDGNPFFIEEIVKVLIASGDIFRSGAGWERKDVRQLRIPRSVRDAVQRRAERLNLAARQVLDLAAVAGRRFDFTMVLALTGLNERDLLDALRELIAAQLVVEESDERFAFRHALTRQAVYAELLARERKALHRTIAEAIEGAAAGTLDGRLTDLVFHFYEAGVWSKALAYGERAGAQAQALHAPRAAVEHFSRALDAAARLGANPPAHVLRARGLAWEQLGEFAHARSDLEAALAHVQSAGDRRAEWQALLDLGMLWASRDYARTGDYYQQALTLARELYDPAALAHSLNWLGNWRLNVERHREGQSHHEEALAIFQGLNDPRGIAETLDLLGLACNMSGDLPRSAAYYRQAVERFRELDDRQRLASSLTVLASRGMGYVSDTLVSDMTAAGEPVREAEEALHVVREIGWRAGEAYALAILGDCLGTQGQFGRGLDCAREGLGIATEIEHHEWLVGSRVTLGVLHHELLAPSAACQHLEQALTLAEPGSPYWTRITAGLLALAYVAAHDLERAAALLERMLTPDTPALMLGQRLCWCALAELYLAQDDPARALDTIDRLIASAPNISDGHVIPRLWHVRSEALTALGRASEAEPELRAAADTAALQGRRPLLWRIHLSLGRLYRGQARHEEARHEFNTARALVEDLAAPLADIALGRDFFRQATALLPAPRSLTPRQAAKRAFGGLTTREREVATLIAWGKTNRAIAESLVVSERTVEGHVANILSKLGFTARTQIAAWAVETGLARRNE